MLSNSETCAVSKAVFRGYGTEKTQAYVASYYHTHVHTRLTLFQTQESDNLSTHRNHLQRPNLPLPQRILLVKTMPLPLRAAHGHDIILVTANLDALARPSALPAVGFLVLLDRASLPHGSGFVCMATGSLTAPLQAVAMSSMSEAPTSGTKCFLA